MTPRRLGKGRYEIQESLGSGGMAGVFRARDHWFGRDCALKVLLPSSARSHKTRTRFLSEARTMAVLDHPNVIRVLDVGEEDGQFYFAMELAAGGSLADLVRNGGPRPPREALVHTFHVLRGLDYAHAAGVIHRDVKPHNMLLARPLPVRPLSWQEQLEHPVRLTDFGIARLIAADGGARITGTGDTLGTLAYMSPEQRIDARRAGTESDIYGVGATLYLLLTGRRPFDLAMAHLEPAVYDRLPPEIAPIVRRATAPDPADRYPSARDMAEAVAEAWTALRPDGEVGAAGSNGDGHAAPMDDFVVQARENPTLVDDPSSTPTS